MNFETVDWELEARRVAAAFGIAQGTCKFHLNSASDEQFEERCLLLKNGGSANGDGFVLDIIYTRLSRYFAMCDNATGDLARVHILWNGELRYVKYEMAPLLAEPLARALDHLDLLTPEIEAELKISVSAHQKIKWVIEHSKVMQYGIVDWDAEAARIARAFDIQTPLRFRLKTKAGIERRDLLSGSHSHIVVDENLRLSVIYKPDSLYFKLHDKEVATWIRVGYTGDFYQGSMEPRYSRPLAKGLFHLGLLGSFTEELLGWSISAHEKLEWALEYEQRYGL